MYDVWTLRLKDKITSVWFYLDESSNCTNWDSCALTKLYVKEDQVFTKDSYKVYAAKCYLNNSDSVADQSLFYTPWFLSEEDLREYIKYRYEVNTEVYWVYEECKLYTASYEDCARFRYSIYSQESNENSSKEEVVIVYAMSFNILGKSYLENGMLDTLFKVREV